MFRAVPLTAALLLAAGMAGRLKQAQPDAALPPGGKLVWDAAKAYRETTPTRERLCLNGLWRWEPAEASAVSVPAAAGWARCLLSDGALAVRPEAADEPQADVPPRRFPPLTPAGEHGRRRLHSASRRQPMVDPRDVR